MFSLRLTKIQHHYSLTNAFHWVFRIKPIARLIFKHEILGSHRISDQSLLLSTIILNDSYVHNYAACTGILVGLAGGNSFNEGRVVVYENSTRGTVCGEGWTNADADVVCKQLGFGLSGIVAYFGKGSGSVLIGNVACNGRESTLASCSHLSTIRNCTHSEDAGVQCYSQSMLNACIHTYIHIPGTVLRSYVYTKIIKNLKNE